MYGDRNQNATISRGYMSRNSIMITEALRETVNGFLETDFIPECAVGNETVWAHGSVVFRSFNTGKIQGYRTLDEGGSIFNIIQERIG